MINKFLWSFIHNCIAHPLLFFTFNSSFAVRFHDYSSVKMHAKFPKLYKRVND